MRMLPFPGGGGESSWHIRPSESRGGVSGPLRGWKTPLVSQPLIFPSRCSLGTPEKWVDNAVILNELTQSLNRILELLITNVLAYYKWGSGISHIIAEASGRKAYFYPELGEYYGIEN